MSLKEWEQDVVNRQRNIVFPDTNLNEGRFYRNIASGRAVFSVGQKISVLILLTYFLTITCVAFAGLISESVSSNRHYHRSLDGDLNAFFFPLTTLLFWLFLAVKGLSPVERKRKMRRGYRSTGR
jgi:uncharacterized membrane protein (DUF485 family)